MNVSQIDDRLSIVSTASTSYGFIHVIQDVRINATTVVSEEYTDSISYYTFVSDGYFIVTEFKLPTTPGEYYYLSGEFIYDPEGELVTLEELLDLETAGTSIVRTDEDYITMYFLENYYLQLLKSKYLKNICNCGCGCIDKNDKVKLDTLTMGLDLIEALLAKVQYYEVQRIAEKLQVCFGIVDNNCNCR